jgi:hypothetical protein
MSSSGDVRRSTGGSPLTTTDEQPHLVVRDGDWESEALWLQQVQAPAAPAGAQLQARMAAGAINTTTRHNRRDTAGWIDLVLMRTNNTTERPGGKPGEEATP